MINLQLSELYNVEACEGLELIKHQQQQLKIVISLVLEQQQQIKSICSSVQQAQDDFKLNLKNEPSVRTIPQECLTDAFSMHKKQIQKRRRHTHQRNYQQGRWSIRENRLYLQFLNKFHKIINQSDLKREHQIFKQMSLFIRSRTPAQCRSHHKKFDYTSYLAQLTQKT